MKKSFLIGLLLLGTFTLTGCVEVMDKTGMVNPEEDIPEGGGERITVVTEMCEEEGGKVEQRLEGGEKQDVCRFPDESFCYLEDLSIEECHKGDIKYYDENE